ncbi:hypothetical protein [Candidatus Magnetaquicoccus inordinatus]|uniref:hypothetical protein n=1 Tax=Candidatus Magnetaquicoccus inordinatus TaxID=2496818 RepID=UPI001290EB59|nr:hypothetical protein [Candidatus Magnetaquicoccus inordinatus]
MDKRHASRFSGTMAKRVNLFQNGQPYWLSLKRFCICCKLQYHWQCKIAKNRQNVKPLLLIAIYDFLQSDGDLPVGCQMLCQVQPVCGGGLFFLLGRGSGCVYLFDTIFYLVLLLLVLWQKAGKGCDFV